MDEQPVYYDADTRRRIADTVEAYEGGVNGFLGSLAGRVIRAAFQIKLGKADSAITKGTSGTVSEYAGTTAGSESDTGTNYTVFVRFADVGSGKWIIFFRWFGHWEALMCEC